MIAQDGNCCSKSSKQSLDRKERSPGDSCRQEEQKENEPEQNACSGGNREIRKPRVNRRQPDVRGAEETKFHTYSRSHLAPSRPGLSLRVLDLPNISTLNGLQKSDQLSLTSRVCDSIQSTPASTGTKGKGRWFLL